MKKKKNKQLCDSLLQVYVSTMRMTERERQNIERALKQQAQQPYESPLLISVFVLQLLLMAILLLVLYVLSCS
jgi:uncharacterized membrane protein YidH (DUF202 family)